MLLILLASAAVAPTARLTPLSSNVGASPSECYDSLKVSALLEATMAFVRLWCNPIQACGVVPRIRVSASNPLTGNLRLALYYYTPAKVYVTMQTLGIDCSVTVARAWYDFPAIDLSAVARDADVPTRIPLMVRVGAYIEGAGAAALHELAFGVVS